MKQLLITMLLAVTGFSSQAQKSETRKSEDFTALEVQNGIEVIFSQSTSTGLKVETDDNLENIVTEYKRGVLKVYMKENNKKIIQGHAKVYVSAKNVTDFKVSTGSYVKIQGKLVLNELTVKLNTGASFAGEAQCLNKCKIKAESGSMFRGIIKTTEFEAIVTGGASIKVTGNTNSSIVFCNSGSLLAGKFISNNANVKTINASTAFINTNKSITANTDNSSSITYFGEPADVNLGENTYSIKRDNLKLALNN